MKKANTTIKKLQEMINSKNYSQNATDELGLIIEDLLNESISAAEAESMIIYIDRNTMFKI